MTDNVAITAGSGTTIATDDVAGVHHQIVKVGLGADGAIDTVVDSGQQTMANSVPVTLASNQSDVKISLDGEAVVLGAGSAAIGKLAANDGVDIGNVDVASIAAGDNNIGNVDIVTMPNVTLAAGTNTNEVVGDVAHDSATAGNPVLVGGVASAAAPTSVDADGDVVRAWMLRNGSRCVTLTAAGALIGGDAANGIDVDVTRLPALVAGTANIGDVDVLTIAAGDNNIGNVDIVTVPSDPFGANADAASATGSISAKLRFLAATGLAGMTALPAGTNAIGKLAANSGVDIGDIDVTSIVPGTTATSLGKAEDAQHTTGDTGVMMLGVRSAAPTDRSAGPTDADYEPLALNEVGAVWETPTPSANGGLSTMNASSSDGGTALTSTAQAIKASAGNLYGYYIYNPNTVPIYVQFYNTASGSVTVGTTNPLFMLTIPAGSAANLMFTMGVAFSTAISWAAVMTTAGGNTAPTTGLDAVAWYK